MSSDNPAAQRIHLSETSGVRVRSQVWEFLRNPLGYQPRALAVFVGAMCLTCNPDCDLSNQDQAFKVTLLKRTSDYSCALPSDPDPLIGQSFTILINDRAPGRGGDCGCGAGPILESPTAMRWSNATPQLKCQGPMYSVIVDVESGECTTQSYLSLYATGPTTSSDPDNTGARLGYGNPCHCGGLYSVTIEQVALPE